MSYDHVATIFCPLSMVADGNQLAACLGLSLGDLETFNICCRKQDSNGNVYAVTAPQVTSAFLDKVGTGIAAYPDWAMPDENGVYPVDLVAAQRALDRVVIYSGVETVGPDIILAVIDVPAVEAIGLMGLTGIPVE